VFDGANQDLVVGRDSNGYPVSNWDFSVLAPAGGLLSNVEDLSKYVLSQFKDSNPELELMRHKTLHVDVQRDMGLGWHIVNSMETSDKLFTHGGGTGGYTSSILVDLKNQIGIVILSNVSSFNPSQDKIELLSYDLIKSMRKKYAISN
jgi:CubicO group peptidase (beta-lactamase class C family)